MRASTSQKLRTGNINDEEWERISESAGRLSEANIYIDDTPGITMVEMRSKARRLMMEHGFDLLIVDYLQLMQGSGGGRAGHENRVQEISEISRGLKGLARELNVPVMALSQLSRAVESRTEKKPQLSDLRESGCLDRRHPVYLPDLGVYRPIEQLVGQSGFRVLALNTDTWKLEPATVSNAFATGHKLVYRLTTRLGRTLRATANHKFLTIEGWHRLDELAAGTTPRAAALAAWTRAGDDESGRTGFARTSRSAMAAHCRVTLSSTRHANAIWLKRCVDLAVAVFGDKLAPRISQERGWYQVYLTRQRAVDAQRAQSHCRMA